MCSKYFELSSSIKLNSNDYNYFCENLLKCSENEGIFLQKDMNYFQNSYMLTGFHLENHYKISDEDYSGIKKVISKLGKNSRIISCDFEFNQFITELFKNYKTMIYKIGCDTLFYKTNSKHSMFLEKFFNIFTEKLVHSKNNLTYYLNLKRLSLPEIDLKNPYIFKQHIYSGNSESDFYRADKYALENVMRLNTGQLLKFPYHKGTIKEKFILLKSLLRVNREENLPTNNIHKIIKNLGDHDYIETFNYYYYNLICNHEKIEDFRSRRFETLEKAVSFSIDLEIKDIRGYLIEFMGDFFICYENDEDIQPSGNIEKNKLKVIEELEKYISKDNNLKEYSLDELINIQIFNNEVVIGTDIIVKDKPLPLDLIINRGVNIYNLTGNLLDFKNKNYLDYDRSNFNLDKNIEIELIEKIDTYYSIIINFENMHINYDMDFYIPEKTEDFESGIAKAIRKGYLISDTGLVRYITRSELMIEDIKFPCWFKSETDEEFLFLMNFLKQI